MSSKGLYEAYPSSLLIEVVAVKYRGPNYFKANIRLIERLSGRVVEQKNYKLYYENITHWRKLDGKPHDTYILK